MDEIRILGIDLSTTVTGYARRAGDNIEESGTIKVAGNTVTERIEFLRSALLPVIQKPYHYVILERSFVKNAKATRVICEAQGVIKNLIHRMGHTLLECSPSTWRLLFLGGGNADKQAAIEAVKLRGYKVGSNDEAEAIGIALAWGDEMMEVLRETQKEKKARVVKEKKVKAVKPPKEPKAVKPARKTKRRPECIDGEIIRE